MMKKILLTLLSAAFTTALFAQNEILTTPVDQSFQATFMSHNRNFLAGENSDLSVPSMWNTTTNQFVQVVVPTETGEPMMGAFNAISNNGIAVGSISDFSGNSIAIMADFNANGNYTELYRLEGETNADAWGITDDGSTIAGFYFTNWTDVHACVWTNNGQTRTELPVPTQAQMGFGIDYVSARYISADGNTVLGYAQSEADGEWVALAWRKVNGEYQPLCFAQDYYLSINDDNAGPIAGKYFAFEPTALSADGNWAVLSVTESFDPWDFDYAPVKLLARYNLTTNTLEVLHSNIDNVEISGFGIANDGTCVGRLVEMNRTTSAIIWYPAAQEVALCSEGFAGDSYFDNQSVTTLSSISPEGNYIAGFAMTEYGDMTSFVAPLNRGTEGISQVDAQPIAQPCIKGIFDMYGRKLDAIRGHGIYIIDGKKVIR